VHTAQLNNGLNAISVGHTSYLTGLYEGRGAIEARLARGATHWEVTSTCA
jgi:hypothetical protein